MAVEVGGIYFSAELDDKKLNQSIKQIESNIRLMSGSVTTNVNKSTESFKALTKTISYSQDTIIGLTNRVERLQSALNKSKIGTEGFDRLNKALTDTKKKIEEVTTGIPGINPPLQKTNSLIKSIGQSVASIGLTALASSVVTTTAKFEKYEAVLTNTYQSSEQAKKSFAFIKEFAASTPFSVDELTSSFIKFLNRGLEPTKESLTAFGDIAASQGKSFDQFTEAVLDATSGGGFERLKEFGIQASQAGDKVSLSFKNQTVVVDKNNKAIEQALINFGKMPGVADSMASVSKTTEGAFSNLGDAMDSLKVALGTVFLPLVKDITIGLASIVTSSKNFIEGLSPLGIGLLKTAGIMGGIVIAINGVVGALGVLGVSSTSTGLIMAAAFNPVTASIGIATIALYALITGLEEASKKSQELANKNRENRVIGLASGEITIALAEMKKLDSSIKTTDQAYKGLNNTLGSIATIIQDASAVGMEASIQSIESAAAAASGVGLKKLSQELLQNKNNAKLAKEAIDTYQKRLQEFKQNQTISSPQSVVSDKKGSDFKYISDLDRANAALSKSLKKGATESSQLYGDLFEKIKSIGESWKALKDNMSNKDWANAVAAGAETAKKGLQAFGGAMLEIMAANSKLAQVKFTNLSQNVDFAVNAVLASYDRQQEALLANIDNEIAAIDEQKRQLLEAETKYQTDLAMIRSQFSEEEKAKNDEAYNLEVQKLEADYQKKLEYLQANTADEAQFAVQKALLQDDLDNAKIKLRQTFDERLLATIATNDKKLDAEQAVRANTQLSQQEALDEQKTVLEQKRVAAEAQAEAQKQDLIKKTELLKWAAGRGAFEMQKQQQMAQVKMQMASIIMSAIQAVAGMTASTLGFGLVPALAIGATLTAMGLSASATSMAAIQSTQYPPPPVFAEGGIVGGNSFTGDKVDAKVNSGEMILNASQQAQLFGMANGKGGGAVNNIYLGGVKVESMKNSNVNEIASRVSDIIRKDIYQAYGGLTA